MNTKIMNLYDSSRYGVDSYSRSHLSPIFTSMIMCLLTFSYVYAEEERAVATLKAEYEALCVTHDKEGNPKEEIRKWILQMAPGQASYYYNPQTFFVDSLENDPVGKTIREQALSDALHEFMETGVDAFAVMKEKGLMPEGSYKCIKDFSANTITVWDINGADRYQYEVDMNDLSWEPCDSTATVLDYECFLATANYHGRRWKAWFAPDVPVQEGPWQLCGLPGLIMKAATDDGAYAFTIKGIQECNETFKPNYIDQDRLYRTKRKSYLKMRDYGRRNRSAHIAAMTNGNVKVNADYTGTDDYLETDYHE